MITWIIALVAFSYVVFFLGFWAGIAYANRQIRKKYDFFEPLLFRALFNILTQFNRGELTDEELFESLNEEMDRMRSALD